MNKKNILVGVNEKRFMNFCKFNFNYREIKHETPLLKTSIAFYDLLRF